MLAKVFSGATVGLDCVPITVEIDMASQGLPSFTIVGLPGKAVEEAKERVRSAIRNSGAEFPARRFTVNLAPADLPKAGPGFDLPIAVGVLLANGQLDINTVNLEKTLVLGELSLDGSLRHTNGILAMAMMGKEKGFEAIFLPAIDAKEAAVISGIKIYPVSSLLQLFHHLKGGAQIEPRPHLPFSKIKSESLAEFDFCDIKGQEYIKRALEIAASGGHNVFMRGVPGAGKTMLSRALPGILPDLTEEEALEVTKIYSITGNLPVGESVIKTRPFRAPHHTTSRIGLIGGGAHPMPGEISLAHRGVLFLDEFPEFPRHVLEALRQPLEDGMVSISRAAGSLIFPAKFLLVAASNPCPCGYLGDPVRRCTCPPSRIAQYQQRVSGPLMDRIDIHLVVPAVKVEKLTVEEQTKKEESSKIIKQRVQLARNIQTKRFSAKGGSASGGNLVCNAEMSTKDIKQFCPLTADSVTLLRQAVTQMGLSARSYYRVIKVARTIADLEGSESILQNHISETLQYRAKDKDN